MSATELDIRAYEWSDEICPTIHPGTISIREASMLMLTNMDFSHIFNIVCNDMELDPLICYGVTDCLYSTQRSIKSNSGSRWGYSREVSHLHSWITCHMKRHHICTPHESGNSFWGNYVPFDTCFVGEDHAEDCDFAPIWALHGNPYDFLRLAMELYREGWTPDV